MAEYKRKIRVECDPEQPTGFSVKLTDLDTGKEIDNAFKCVVTLAATEINTAEISYYKTGETGSILTGPDLKPEIETETVECPEVHLTAYEVQ